MIVLDTDVVSATMRRGPDPTVDAWLDRQPVGMLWITSITVFEIRFGIELLLEGRRRRALEHAFAGALETEFDGRILPFDRRAAEETARLAARRQRDGRPVGYHDTQIAGIALARQATIATRNMRHFSDLPVPVVNPWEA